MLKKYFLLRVGSIMAVLFVATFESVSAAGMPQIEANPKPVVESIPKFDPNLKIPFDDVDVFHNRMRCEKGETKQLVVGGSPDSFAAPIDAYANGQPIGNFPNTEGYDSEQPNEHFFERLEVPSDITKGYLLFALRSNGTTHQDNDTIFFGDYEAKLQNSGNHPGIQVDLTALDGIGFQSTGVLNTPAGAQYFASLSDIELVNGQPMLEYIQNGSVTANVDTYLQDDTSIDFIAYSVCGEAEAVIEPVAECGGENIEIESFYGPQSINEYCVGDPIVLSTAGTTPSDNYFIELQRFDPVDWEGLSPAIHPGAWICTSDMNCPAPAHIMPADYNSTPGQPLDANYPNPENDPNQVYHLKFAVGPIWAEEHHFFRVKKCIEVVDHQPYEPRRIRRQ